MSVPPAIPPPPKWSGVQVHSGIVTVGAGPDREHFAGEIGETVQAGVTFLTVDTPEVEGCGPMTFLIAPSRVTLIRGADRVEVLDFWRSNNPKATQQRIDESIKASLATMRAWCLPLPKVEID